jgi:hypothetical protein
MLILKIGSERDFVIRVDIAHVGLNWYLMEIGWNIYREYTDVTW